MGREAGFLFNEGSSVWEGRIGIRQGFELERKAGFSVGKGGVVL